MFLSSQFKFTITEPNILSPIPNPCQGEKTGFSGFPLGNGGLMGVKM
jgi:hypothetical protein